MIEIGNLHSAGETNDIESHTCSRAVRGATGTTLLAFSIVSKDYRGAGQALVSGLLGDVIFVAAVYFLLRTVLTRLPSLAAIATVLAAAFTVEILQGLGTLKSGRGKLIGYWLGQSFDPMDFVAYLVGAALALSLNRALCASASK